MPSLLQAGPVSVTLGINKLGFGKLTIELSFLFFIFLLSVVAIE